MQTTINREALPPSLQQDLEAFDAQASSYLTMQKRRVEIIQETDRLEQAATALDAEAVTGTAACKAMAKDHKADQRKINTEIERVLKLKAEAGKFRDTASWRLELHSTATIDIAKTRRELEGKAIGLNARYRAERLKALLATEEFAASLHGVLGDLYDLLEGTPADFGGQLVTLIKQSRDGRGRALVVAAVVPCAQSGEAVATSDLAIKRLIESCGEVPSQRLGRSSLRTA